MVFDPDVWSYFIVVSVVKSLGYDGFKELWFSVGCGPILDDRLEPLSDDVGAMHMVNLATLNGQVHLYVVHNVYEAEVIQMIEYNVDEAEVEGGDPKGNEFGEGAEVVVEEAEMIETEVEGGDAERTEDLKVQGKELEVEEGDGEEVVVEEVVVEEVVVEEDVVEETSEVEVDEVVVEEVQEEGDRLHGKAYRIEVEDLNDIEVKVRDGNDGLIDINVQCDLPENETEVEVEVEPLLHESESDSEEDEIDDSSWFNDEWESEDLTSPLISDEESEEEEGYGNYSTFTMPKVMVDYKWDVGTYFGDKNDILDAIKSYGVENGKNLKIVKNDRKRVRVKCLGSNGQCSWVTYFGFMDAVKSWQLRTINDSHTCSREHKLQLFNAKWLSRKLQKTIRDNPNVKGVEIIDKFSRKWNIAISKNMTYRAKGHASDEVEGSFIEQYRRIYDYAHELLARNPGSTIKVQVDPVNGKPIFRRFYACLKACKYSFVSCRPIIGLDGAFLKGRHHGELLTAVGRDANDQMLPLLRWSRCVFWSYNHVRSTEGTFQYSFCLCQFCYINGIHHLTLFSLIDKV
ncbi:hypothetical protein V8G54_017686 [Vigna mungo]|uniref:Transposase MuDR plant domain-containing protein n=1 Tax=Vigna mungo TaxID=3915 RepID=A0AAQ3S2A1_VIGMU